MNKILTSILILSAIYFSAFQSVASGQTKSGKYTIVVHGGAGGFPENAPDSTKQAYLNSLSEALTIGKNILANGGSSLDAVEKVINYLEDNPLFNAGRGGVFTSEGK
uniref:isoaspartyl peptidase/L-asparaginase n=1 Tax=Ignavibacterium sp. TaxID=2651167 RepID=UPI0025B88B0E